MRSFGAPNHLASYNFRHNCRNGDARCGALRAASAVPAEKEAIRLVFGTPESAAAFIGYAENTNIQRKSTNVFDILDSRSVKFGYFGFGANHHGNLPNLGYPTFSIAEASIQIEATKYSLRVLVGNLGIKISDRMKPCLCLPMDRLTSAIEFDSEIPDDYKATILQAREWCKGGPNRRLTCARRVWLPRPPMPMSSLLGNSCEHRIERSYWFRSNTLEFFGVSPELLAEGTANSFATHKLSGTAPLSPGGKELIRTKKIQHEHCLSADSYKKKLESNFGNVNFEGPHDVRFSKIRHLVTTFTLDRNGILASDLLSSIMPTGSSPEKEGLDKLAQIEHTSRGVYYGLVGFIAGNKLEFSQVLRTVVTDHQGSHISVGAAVTSMSDPQDEYLETRTKLSAVQLAFP